MGQTEQREYAEYLLSTDPEYLTWNERYDRETLLMMERKDERQDSKPDSRAA